MPGEIGTAVLSIGVDYQPMLTGIRQAGEVAAQAVRQVQARLRDANGRFLSSAGLINGRRGSSLFPGMSDFFPDGGIENLHKYRGVLRASTVAVSEFGGSLGSTALSATLYSNILKTSFPVMSNLRVGVYALTAAIAANADALAARAYKLGAWIGLYKDAGKEAERFANQQEIVNQKVDALASRQKLQASLEDQLLTAQGRRKSFSDFRLDMIRQGVAANDFEIRRSLQVKRMPLAGMPFGPGSLEERFDTIPGTSTADKLARLANQIQNESYRSRLIGLMKQANPNFSAFGKETPDFALDQIENRLRRSGSISSRDAGSLRFTPGGSRFVFGEEKVVPLLTDMRKSLADIADRLKINILGINQGLAP